MTAAAADAPLSITEPGVYEMPNDVYHADPVPGGSLSSTGARRLLPPSCPAIFKWERDHGRPDKRAFDLGHAAHDAVLGGGPEIVAVDADNWLTKAAKQQRDEIRARGAVPLLAAEYAVIQDMAETLRAHPFAGRLFEPGTGTPEACVFARDEVTGVMLRARLDWLQNVQAGRRFLIADLKTCRCAQRDEFMKEAARYGYHQQLAFYKLVCLLAGISPRDVACLLVAQEKTAPYVVNVIQLPLTALRIGDYLNRKAIDLYGQCIRDDRWPGYSDDVEIGDLPVWYERQFEGEFQ